MISLDAPSDQEVRATLTLTGTALQSGDFVLSSNAVRIPAGMTSTTVNLTVIDDLAVEATETVELSLTNIIGAVAGDVVSQMISIQNNDNPPPPPTVQFALGAQTVQESAGTRSITVNLSAAATQEVTASVVVSGTATMTSDFSLASNTVRFAAGATSATVSLTIVDDTMVENTETVILTLVNPMGATLGSPSIHTVSIQNNDMPPPNVPTLQFSLASQSVQENAGTLTVVANLSATSTQEITATVLLGGTATMTSDYLFPSNTVRFAPGVTSANISLTLVDDSAVESAETVILTLSNLMGASLGTNSTHTVSIQNNDVPPPMPTMQFTMASQSVQENAGTRNITINLSAASTQEVTASVVVSGTATMTSDYLFPSNTVRFAAGTTSANVALTIVDDTAVENPETIILTLSNLSGASLGATTTHTVTVQSNDSALPMVRFTTDSQSITEGGTQVTVPVALSAASATAVTVPFTVSGSATVPADHNLASGTVVIAANAVSQTITFSMVSDTTAEPNETVVLTLGTPTGATLGSPSVHTVTILDNDSGNPNDFTPPPFKEWTDFPAASYSSFIYVSSNSGNDSNAGTSANTPVATFANAITKARAVGAHGILLERGSVWNTNLEASIPGRSRTLKFLISSYGRASAPRPRIHYLGSAGAVNINENNIAAVDLYLEGAGKFSNPDSYGFQTRAGVRGALMEGNMITGHKTGFRIENTGDLTIRRNVITSQDRHGIITSAITNAPGEFLLIEENVFHLNGNDPVFDQQIYKASDTDRVVIRRNIFGQGGNHSVKWRSGSDYGEVSENVFINGRNPINSKADHENPNNRSSDYLTIRDNVFMKTIGSDPSPTEAAIFLKNARHGRILRNYIIDITNPGGNANIVLSAEQEVIDAGRGTTPGLVDIEVAGNVMGGINTQGIAIRSGSGATELTNIRINNNIMSLDVPGATSRRCIDSVQSAEISFSGNHYYSVGSNWFRIGGTPYTFAQWQNSIEANATQGEPNFFDPSRTIERYNQDVAGGAATFEDFMAGVMEQSRDNWQAHYTAPAILQYFREALTVR